MKPNCLAEQGVTIFVFLGEAGCGKSEISLNVAIMLGKAQEKPVHFFDLDMTKPLFRSRDAAKVLEKADVTVHFVEQFMDTPVTVGGLDCLLKDDSCYVVMDVGGDAVGARAIGPYASKLRNDNVAVYYVLNPYCPWSTTLEHIDGTLTAILGVTYLDVKKLAFVGNPNLGITTTASDFQNGIAMLKALMSGLIPLKACFLENHLYKKMTSESGFVNKLSENLEVIPIQLYLSYEWAQI